MMKIDKEFYELLYQHQLDYSTDKNKSLILSISKKVYTKMRKSPKFPIDVQGEFGDAIRERNYEYLSLFCSKPSLQLTAIYLK